MGERLVTLAGQKDKPADAECPAEVKGCYGFVRGPFVTGIPRMWLLNVLVPCATQMSCDSPRPPVCSLFRSVTKTEHIPGLQDVFG